MSCYFRHMKNILDEVGIEVLRIKTAPLPGNSSNIR
jgi:hypothetical protein